jgi:hypothetical protein
MRPLGWECQCDGPFRHLNKWHCILGLPRFSYFASLFHCLRPNPTENIRDPPQRARTPPCGVSDEDPKYVNPRADLRSTGGSHYDELLWTVVDPSLPVSSSLRESCEHAPFLYQSTRQDIGLLTAVAECRVRSRRELEPSNNARCTKVSDNPLRRRPQLQSRALRHSRTHLINPSNRPTIRALNYPTIQPSNAHRLTALRVHLSTSLAATLPVAATCKTYK